MNTLKTEWNEVGVTAELTSFLTATGVDEFHAILHVAPRGELFAQQEERLQEGFRRLMAMPEMSGAKVVFKRYFLSDATNQRALVNDNENVNENVNDNENVNENENYNENSDAAVSYIQQPPLDGSKIALWVYMMRGVTVTSNSAGTIVEHNGCRHIWTMGMVETEGDSAQQTDRLLTRYEALLNQENATLADNCIRTWFFVRDVDTQYAGMVKARRDFFTEKGLTADTHYIASTGIGGSPADTKALVQLGCYAVTGFQPQQLRYLYAPTHLNRTSDYGVTFERGTLMTYTDRKHIFISGTASIDNKGQVVHVGDIVKQTHRMWENVETLLAEGGMTFGDVMQIIVYLRDTADYETVRRMFEEKFPDTPYVITLAPVCRPTWLIEMECIAVSE